jgi:hypothetical protein
MILSNEGQTCQNLPFRLSRYWIINLNAVVTYNAFTQLRFKTVETTNDALH